MAAAQAKEAAAQAKEATAQEEEQAGPILVTKLEVSGIGEEVRKGSDVLFVC